MCSMNTRFFLIQFYSPWASRQVHYTLPEFTHSFPPFHYLDTHLLKAVFGFARREEANTTYRLVRILLCEGSGLLKTIGL